MAAPKTKATIKVVETSEDIQKERKTRAEMSVTQAESNRRNLLKHYKSEEMERVSVSPHYAGALGRVMQVSINGIVLWVPINGKTYKLPVTFATEVRARVSAQDKILMRNKRMANVSQNKEDSPGNLDLFN